MKLKLFYIHIKYILILIFIVSRCTVRANNKKKLNTLEAEGRFLEH